MIFKSPLAWPLALLTFAAVLTRADDGGGGGEEGEGAQSSKTFDASFSSHGSTQDGAANVSYTVKLTDNVTFSTSTSLSNSQSTEDNSVSRNRNTSFAMDYDPASPWRLNVNFSDAYALEHRPASQSYDEFKTESSHDSVASTLSYDVTKNLKTNLNLTASDNLSRVVITGGNAPPPVSTREYRAGGGYEYNLTPSTNVKMDYAVSYKPTDVEVSRSKTYPPRPAKPVSSRQVIDSLNGGVNTNKDLWDGMNLYLSLTGNRNVTRDTLILASPFENEYLNAYATGGVTWNPVSLLTFSNTADLTTSRQTYLNKPSYREQFHQDIYDQYKNRIQTKFEVKIAPSAKTDVVVADEYTDAREELWDGKRRPLPGSTEANSYVRAYNNKLSSAVGLALLEDVAFHLTYFLEDVKRCYDLKPQENNLSRSNNLEATIGFDWTEKLRVDVATAMKSIYTRYDEYRRALTADTNDVDVKLNTGLIYTLDPRTSAEFNVQINKTALTYENPELVFSGNTDINRSFSAVVRRDFGRVFKPSCAVTMALANRYPGNSLQNNTRTWQLGVGPTADFSTSDALTLHTGFNFNRSETDRVYNPDPDDWYRRDDYRASLGVVYMLASNLTFNFDASQSHSVEVQNRFRRFRVYPAESFFDLNANLSYTF